MMTVLATVLRLFGFINQAIQIEQMIEKKMKAQRVANTPTTKKEISDAADRGDL